MRKLFPRLSARNYRLIVVCAILIGLVSFGVSVSSHSGDAAPGETQGAAAQQNNPAQVIASVFNFPMPLPSLTVQMADSFPTTGPGNHDVDADGKADVGDKIRYTVTIANSGTDAANVTLQDTIDPNTSLVGVVNVSPTALNDSYETFGNTLLEVGIAASGNPAVRVTDTSKDSLFDNDKDYLGDTFTFDIVTVNPTKGTVNVNADGTFTYQPNAGATGTDTFTYRIKDGNGLTDTAVVTITINAQELWYVKNNVAGPGTGTSTDPFKSLSSADTASGAGDYVYVFLGNGTNASQSAGITLDASQRLIGEGVQLDVPVALNGGANPTVLRSVGSAPTIGNSGGNGVTVTNVSGVQVRGLIIGGTANAIGATFSVAGGSATISNNSLSGSGGNAIDVTTSGTGGADITVSNNTVTGATAEGFDFNGGGSGTLNLSISTNTVTSAGNGIDIERTSGNVNVVSLDGNSITGTTGGIGIKVLGTGARVIFDSNLGSSGAQTVSGGNTVIGASGNGVTGQGLVLDNVGGDLSFTDLDIFADGTNALFIDSTTSNFVASSTTGFRLTANTGTPTLVATAGAALNVSQAQIQLAPTTFSSTNSAGSGVSLLETSGSFSAPSGSSITNATGTDFLVNASGASQGTANVSVTYAGTITDDAGQLVSITNVTASSTHTFSGLITDNFDGDGGETGISLTGNTGATITFSGGINVRTTNQPAFTATGGGTLNITDPVGATANKLQTTTGTPINVANTTIGASGLTFESISSNGASNGIALTNTGTNPFQVTGDGSNTSVGGNGTGGTIQNTAGADDDSPADGVGVGVRLVNAHNVSLRRMNITTSSNYGIYGESSTNFTFEYSTVNGTNGTDSPGGGINNVNNPDASVYFNELTGSALFKDALIEGGLEDNVRIINTGGTLNRVTFNNVTIDEMDLGNARGDNALFIQGRNNAVINVTVQNSDLNYARGDIFQFDLTNTASGDLIFDNNTVNNQHPFVVTGGGGITLSGGGVSNANTNLTYEFDNNTFRGARGSALLIIMQTGAGSANGRIEGNSFGVSGVDKSGASEASCIEVRTEGRGAQTVLINNNQIRQYAGFGIYLEMDGINTGGSTGTIGGLNATITNNIIEQPNTALVTHKNGIHLNHGATSGDTYSSCVDINNNTTETAGSETSIGQDMILRNRMATTLRLPGYLGTTGNGAAVETGVETFLQNNNPGSESVNMIATDAGANLVGGAACTPAAARALPNQSNQRQYFALNNSLQNSNASLLAFLNKRNDFSSLNELVTPILKSSSTSASDAGIQKAGPAISSGVLSLTLALAESAQASASLKPELEKGAFVLAHGDNRSASAGSRASRFVSAVAETISPTVHSAPAPAAPMPVLEVNQNIGTLPANETITVVFDVLVDSAKNPHPVQQYSNQMTVKADGISNVLSDDNPGTAAPNEPTITLGDRYNNTTTLTANPTSPAFAGETVTFTATVTPSEAVGVVNPSTGGFVQFKDGVNPMGAPVACVADGNNCKAELQTSTLTTGAHMITAEYVGTHHEPSIGGPLNYTINACTVNPVVTTTADGTSPVPAGSLREAIASVCPNSPSNVITFATGAGQAFDPAAGPHVIQLVAALPDITRSMSISGPGANQLTVQGSSSNLTAFRVFNVKSTATNVNISKMTIGNSASLVFGGGINIESGATVLLSESAVSFNRADVGGGGGIFNAGTLTILRSTISNNVATAVGGGGILNTGTLNVYNSTVSSNTANVAAQGGGVLNSGSGIATFINATVAANFSDLAGGGIASTSSGATNLGNTIVAYSKTGANVAVADLSGVFTSQGNNWIQDASGTSLTSSGDPQIQPLLSNNGGATLTHAPLKGSPVLDAGSNALIDSIGEVTDQRDTGFPRKVDAADSGTTQTVDIGAVESIPTISDIPNKTDALEDITVTGYSFNVGDAAIGIDSITASATSDPSSVIQSVTVNNATTATPDLTIVPVPNTSGTATITVTVNKTINGTLFSQSDTFDITFNAVNDAPVANNDPNYSTDEDSPLTVNTASGVLVNDTDSDGPGMTAVIVSPPANAQSFMLNSDGSFNYTPVSNFNGTDTFTYKANDGTNDSNVATVTITVNAVNDPVTAAVPAALTVNEDSTNNAVAGMSISDVDAALAPAGVYEVTLSSTNGTMSLTTIAGLTFTAGDGTADATMTFNGTLASIDTALATAKYTPDADYSGGAQIQLQVTDTFGGIVATGTGLATNDSKTVNVTVTAQDDAPTLTNNGLTVLEGSTGNTIGSAALSLTDPDNTATGLVFQLASVPANGTLKKNGTAIGINDTFSQDDINNNLITYDHDGSETTSDSFNFTATDGTNNIGSTAFNITVTPQNDNPSLTTNNALTVVPGTTGTIDSTRLAVTDPDNTATDLVYTVGTAPANGALKNNGTTLNGGDTFTQDDINNNVVTYTHNGGGATTDSFTFTVSDGAGGSIGLTTFNININCTTNPVVTTTANDGPGSLRDAVLNACAGNNITFNLDSNTDPNYDSVADTFTITLTTGEMLISRDVTITGPANQRLIISGNNTDPTPANRSRIFNIASGTVTISNLTLANGESQLGGAIYNLGDLTLNGVTLTGNKAVTVLGFGGDGGAIDSDGGSLTIYNSTISGNTADGGGGGIHNCGDSTATLVNVTITGNRSDADDLSPGEGGGFEQVSTNSLTLNNTIVAGNLKGTATPVANDIDVFGPGGIALANSKNNLIGDAATSGGITDGGAAANIVGNAGAGTIDINTVLDTTLANNGGPTRTHKLVPGSLAVNKGGDAAADAVPLTTDQRGTGFNRKVGTVDIGAYEVQAGIANSLAFDVQPSNTNAGVAITPAVTVRLLDVNGNVLNSTANVTVAIGNNPSGGTLSGTTTVAAVGGTATFSDLSINNVGVGYTLTATSTGLGSATSNAFNIISASIISGTKTVSGNFGIGQTIAYTVTLSNNGPGAQLDNATDEFTDVLPAGLTLVSASATSGTAVATVGTNTVTWNGAIAAGGSVTITINATINAGTSGQTLSNQGSISYDADGDAANEAAAVTDDPGVAGANNPTSFIVNAIPTITPVGVTRNAGDAVSSSTIANVNDLEDAENTLTVTVNNNTSATVNGVTVSGIGVSVAGVVTANVEATCAATTASFTLKVADSGGQSSTGTLNVTVNANAAPTLTYSTQAVDIGASLNINPATGPTDTNLSTITVLDTGGYTGGISVNNTTGVIAITNAAPLGSHTITIRATDSCGTTDVQFTLNVNKINQTITFNALTDKTFGDADFTVSATASSNLPVSFGATGNCTVTGNTVSITGAGSCTITASQAGNSTYNAATPVQQSFTINKANTTTVVTVADAGFDGQPHGGTANVTGPGGLNQSLTVTYTGRNATTYGPSTTAPTNAGEYTASASFAATSNYNGSNDSKDFQIGKANQTITFNALTDKTFGDADFTVSATASSNLPVSFGATGNCTVTGNSVHITGAGTCTITASQAGNNNFNAAADVPRTFNIAKQATTTSVSSSVNPSAPGQNVTFTATVVWTSGILTGTVQFKDGAANLGAPVPLTPSGAATLSTNALSAGNHNITAVYSGDANYQTSTGTLNGGQIVSINAGIGIDDVTVTEGNSGTTNAVFTVTLSQASNVNVTVDFATANGTATLADNDYQSATGTLTFNPGETTKTITVLVNGDTKNESNETFLVNLTNAQNGSIGDNQGQGTINNDDTPTVQLSSSTYTINEGLNNTPQGFTSLAVNVTRTGDTSGAATVKYITSDASGGNECNQVTGQASQRCDYILVGATLRFAAGETTKTIQIPIVNDGYLEGAEFFNIELTNAVGVNLGTPSQAIITLQDDAADATPTTSANNPYLSNPFFVRQNYLDLLGRDADQNGFTDWTNVLNNCGPQQGFIGAPKTCDRAHVAHGFFGSVEFTNSGFLIHRLFEVGMGRLPLYREFIPDMATLSGFNLSPAQQQQNLNDYLQEFTSKPEFINRYQGYLLPSQAAQFIGLLEQVAGVTLPATATTGPGQPQQYGRQELINLRAAGTLNVGQTLKAFVEQKLVYDKYFERGEVTMLYFAYLRRDPNLNDPNLIGWNDWVNVFTNGKPSQNVAPRDIHHLIFGFIYSEEYRKRFGQP